MRDSKKDVSVLKNSSQKSPLKKCGAENQNRSYEKNNKA